MFTGLVQELGTITSIQPVEGGGAKLVIDAALASQLSAGDSVAVNGVCLTAVDPGEQSFSADAIRETLARSSLGDLAAGSKVNLELPLAIGDRLGGHVVQGHVDAVGEVVDATEQGNALVVRIAAPESLSKYLVAKGSVAIDGVSLTVASLDQSTFEVWLIPETRERTGLGQAVAGTKVNLEADVLAKYVERLLEK